MCIYYIGDFFHLTRQDTSYHHNKRTSNSGDKILWPDHTCKRSERLQMWACVTHDLTTNLYIAHAQICRRALHLQTSLRFYIFLNSSSHCSFNQWLSCKNPHRTSPNFFIILKTKEFDIITDFGIIVDIINRLISVNLG